MIQSKNPGRFTSDELRGVLRGDADRMYAVVPDGVDVFKARDRAAGLLRQIKDRDGRMGRFTWSLAREKAVRVYVDPERPRTIICDASSYDGRKQRAYAPVMRLEIGQTCRLVLPRDIEPTHVHQHLSYLCRTVEEEFGYRPSFHAQKIAAGTFRVTRLADGANPRFDPLTYSGPTLRTLSSLVEQEIAADPK